MKVWPTARSPRPARAWRTGARPVLAAMVLIAAGATTLRAMPHDVAEARGCKPRIEAVGRFCRNAQRRSCGMEQDGRQRAIAAWEQTVRERHGAGFANWASAYSPTHAVERRAGAWVYIISAYPCPKGSGARR